MNPWTRADDNWLWFHGIEPVAVLAERLGRTEKAIQRRMERLGIRRRVKDTWSVADAAAHAGVHPDVVRRISKELGQRWKSNRKRGSGVRYYLSEDQVRAIVERLKQEWNGTAHARLGCREYMAIGDTNLLSARRVIL